MDKAYKVLTKIFYSLLLVFPFLIAVGLALFNLVIGWDRLGIEGRGNLFYCMDGFLHPWIGIFGVLLITLVMLLIYLSVVKLVRFGWLYCVLAFLCAFTVRGAILLMYKDTIQPFSDFACAWLNARGDLYLLGHYQFYPAYLNYAIFERIITHFDRKYYYVILSSVLLNGATASSICALGKEVLGKWKYGFVAALLYSFLPSGILYAQIGNPEHITVFCNVFGLYLLVLLTKEGRNDHRKKGFSYCIAILAGILFGLGNSMKTFFPVLVVAILISFILMMMRTESGKRRGLRALIPLFFAMILSSTLTERGIYKFTQTIFQIEDHSMEALPDFLIVGFAREGEGQIGKTEFSRIYINMRVNGYDYDTAKEIALRELRKDWEGHWNEIPSFLFKKLIWEWQGDTTPYWYFKYGMEIRPGSEVTKNVFDFINEYGPSIGEVYYLLIMLMGAMATFFELKLKGKNEIGLLLNNLCIFGFFCLMVIIECQSRYKCLIWPFVCITAGSIFRYKNSRNKAEE